MDLKDRDFMWKNIFVIIAAIVLSLGVDAQAVKPKRSAANVRKEQQATKKQIKETTQKINQNTKETKKHLSRLNSLNSEIQAKNTEISKIQVGVDSIVRKIGTINDSITILNNNIELLRANYINSLRKLQGTTGSMSPLSFIFSSRSFTEAYRNMRYMQQFNKWRKNKLTDIKKAESTLSERRVLLDSMQQSRNFEMSKLNSSRKELENAKVQTDKIVAKLKSEGKSLRTVLRQKQEQQRRLDRELDKIIAEEQARIERQRREQERKNKNTASNKKTQSDGTSNDNNAAEKSANPQPATSMAAADRALTGSFESNQGKLLFPVTGKYRIVKEFGRQKHPQLDNVETENSGIDIEALSSKQARAVFEGTVSATFKQPGYGTIVMVRHGNYLTIYANLASINVKNGDKVRTGQTIGTIFTDPDEDNKAILHFELRKERTKLNPMLWVR